MVSAEFRCSKINGRSRDSPSEKRSPIWDIIRGTGVSGYWWDKDSSSSYSVSGYLCRNLLEVRVIANDIKLERVARVRTDLWSCCILSSYKLDQWTGVATKLVVRARPRLAGSAFQHSRTRSRANESHHTSRRAAVVQPFLSYDECGKPLSEWHQRHDNDGGCSPLIHSILGSVAHRCFGCSSLSSFVPIRAQCRTLKTAKVSRYRAFKTTERSQLRGRYQVGWYQNLFYFTWILLFRIDIGTFPFVGRFTWRVCQHWHWRFTVIHVTGKVGPFCSL